VTDKSTKDLKSKLENFLIFKGEMKFGFLHIRLDENKDFLDQYISNNMFPIHGKNRCPYYDMNLSTYGDEEEVV
jgi:hypothetical protein